MSRSLVRGRNSPYETEDSGRVHSRRPPQGPPNGTGRERERSSCLWRRQESSKARGCRERALLGRQGKHCRLLEAQPAPKPGGLCASKTLGTSHGELSVTRASCLFDTSPEMKQPRMDVRSLPGDDQHAGTGSKGENPQYDLRLRTDGDPRWRDTTLAHVFKLHGSSRRGVLADTSVGVHRLVLRARIRRQRANWRRAAVLVASCGAQVQSRYVVTPSVTAESFEHGTNPKAEAPVNVQASRTLPFANVLLPPPTQRRPAQARRLPHSNVHLPGVRPTTHMHSGDRVAVEVLLFCTAQPRPSRTLSRSPISALTDSRLDGF